MEKQNAFFATQVLYSKIAEIAQNRGAYLAKRFKKAMKGMGTDDLQIQYLMARCREPFLMQQVKVAYLALFNKTLREDIKSELSGDYEKLCLEIIGA